MSTSFMDIPSHKLIIHNLHCASCVNKIETALNARDDVTSATVNLAERTANIESTAKASQLIQTLAEIGYDAANLEATNLEASTGHLHSEQQHLKHLRLQTIIAVIVGLPLLLDMFYPFIPKLNTTYGFISNLSIAIITLITLIFAGKQIYLGAWKSLQNHHATMDSLIALGTGSAWLYSTIVVLLHNQLPELATHLYFESAVIILALTNIGNLLETGARAKTSQAIQQLVSLQPDAAQLLRNGEYTTVAVKDLVLGDVIQLRPGERVAVDGVVIDGQSYIDESMLSGEPIAVKKQIGDEVAAGTINTSGSLQYKATKVGKDTALANIISLVEQAQNSKPPIGSTVDKIANYFVPVVIIIAILTAIVWYLLGPAPQIIHMLTTSMSVLIIACPCALGLATPIAIIVGMGKAAQYGVLIRNGEALQAAANITDVVMDKTGTITMGQPAVVDLVTSKQFATEALLEIATALEHKSEHPLATAIIKYAEQQNIKAIAITDFNAIEGLGVTAKLADTKQNILLGSVALLEKYTLQLTNNNINQQINNWQQTGYTIVYLAKQNLEMDFELIGAIAIADQLKADSLAAIMRIQQANINVHMLTGDTEAAAKQVANQVGIKQIKAQCLPAEKLAYIEKLQQQGKIVAMVGDGINDAPALAKANVGIAIGAGTDVAIESSDITLLRNSLTAVADSIKISTATMRNIKQNLFGALIYNVIGIPIAAGVLYPLINILLNPIIAAIAMSMSSFTVVSNANRLRLFKPKIIAKVD